MTAQPWDKLVEAKLVCFVEGRNENVGLLGVRRQTRAVDGEKSIRGGDTKIGGIRVTAGLPQSGRPVSTLSGIPVLAYNPASGEIEWTVPS